MIYFLIVITRMSKKSTKDISDEVCEIVKKLYMDKMPISKISKNVQISRTSVYKIINNVKNKRRGRKCTINHKLINNQIKRAVKKLGKCGKKISASLIKDNLPEPPSLRTIQKILNENTEISYVKIQKHICLTQFQCDDRLLKIRTWLKERMNFADIIFSDECRFSMDGPDNFQSWQLHDEPIQTYRPMRHMSGGSVMVYGAMGSDGYFVLRKIDGTLDGKKYLELLKKDIIPNIRTHFSDHFIYMHDNARPHTSKIVKRFLESDHVKVLDWPSHSPDMNLIENIWKLMKDKVYQMVSFQNKNELWLKIEGVHAWMKENNKAIIHSLYENYADRLFKIIDRKGNNKA